MNPAERPRRKSHRRYILYRWLFLLSLVVWNGAFFVLYDGWLHYMVFLVPVGVTAILMSFNLMAFRWNYSLFGVYERSPEPDEEPLEIDKGTWGGVGLLRVSMPLWTWRLYPSGLGFSIKGVGSGFVPMAELVGVRASFVVSAWLTHNSAEIRNPLLVPKGRVLYELSELLKSRDVSPRPIG